MAVLRRPNVLPRATRLMACRSGVFAIGLIAVAGCGSGERQANIGLRKQVQSLESKVAELTRVRDADAARFHTLEASVPTVPTLSNERLRMLFTAHGLSLKRLTGGADLDPAKPGDEGLKIYAVPIDDDGDELKAAGAFVVEAFDLADGGKVVGKWTFDSVAARKTWNGAALLYEYVLVCPWQSPPPHADVTLKVTFSDDLTGRSFTELKQVRIKLPAK